MTYLDTLDRGCAVCGSTYTINEKHECAGRNLWSLNEEVVGYIEARRPVRQARPASEIDWPELIFTFVVALIGVAALVMAAFALLPGYPL